MEDLLLRTGINLGIYIILVLSANLTVGMANLMTLCQAAFYGIGAYVGTFFLMHFHLPFTVIAIIVMLAAGIASLPVSFASTRLKGDYFILATLGFQMIVFSVLNNWEKVTGGTHGIRKIPDIRLCGIWALDGYLDYLIFTLALALLCIVFFYILQRSPFGRILRALRTDELSARALGRNTAAIKNRAFFLSAAFAGLAGLVYAAFRHRIAPTTFTLDGSITILTALFIGGIGTRVRGPVIGAAIVVILPVLLRFLHLPAILVGNLQQIVFGLVLIVLMFCRPQGLMGNTILK